MLGIAGFGREAEKLWEAMKQIPDHPPLKKIWSRNSRRNPQLVDFLRRNYLHTPAIIQPVIYNGESNFAAFVRGLSHLIIAAPPEQHLPLLKLASAISDTVEIALEKPLAADYVSARDLVLPDKIIGRVVMIYQLSYHPTFQSFCDRIRSSKIDAAEVRMHKWDPHRRGIWLDLGPHILDMLERLGIWPMETIEGGFDLSENQSGRDQKALLWPQVFNGPSVAIDLSYLEKDEAERGNSITVILANGDSYILDFSQALWKINGTDGERADPRVLMLADWLSGGGRCTRLPSALEHLRLIHAGYLSV